MSLNSMKLIGSRHLRSQVELMEWSQKMDLLAYATQKGEVIIQRLNWQKVVTFPALGEDIKVRSLNWQSNETVLAVGYSNGDITLYDVERQKKTFTQSYAQDIKNVFFTKSIAANDYRNSYRHRKELTFDFFLPGLPPPSGIVYCSKSVTERTSFASSPPCFLVVVLTDGKVHILLLGALKAGSIDLSQHVAHPDAFKVYDVRLNTEFDTLFALVKDGEQLKLMCFRNQVLQKYISPILHLSVHCANILETKSYMNETMQCIAEAWEAVQMEMDNKLTKYANCQPEGTLSADFLELLVFGYATNEIEDFLMDNLTANGLKKLANSVDLSYSAIQSLVSKPLQSAAINMFYFLNTLKGFSRMIYFFEPLLSPDGAEQTMRLCGAFLMKVMELQQVIDQCVNDMKLFFCWLCVVILRLHQEDVTEDITQITTEDSIYLAEYLNSFEDNVVVNEDGTETKRKFNLEKVGQYLENSNLRQVAKADIHHVWNKLLEENDCLRNCNLLYPHDEQSSLIQERDKLFAAIDELFEKPNESISNSFVLKASIVCCVVQPPSDGAEQVVRSSHRGDTFRDLFAVTISCQEVLILEFPGDMSGFKCARISLQPGPFTSSKLTESFENLHFIDLQYYNSGTISLLIKNSKDPDKPKSYFVQFGLESMKNRITKHSLPFSMQLSDAIVAHSILDLLDNSAFKQLDSVCIDLAVSGSRKVAAVVAEDSSKLTLFEMEIEEDEEEAEMSQNSLLDISKESIT